MSSSLTIQALQAMLARNPASLFDIVEATQANIAKSNPSINALCTLRTSSEIDGSVAALVHRLKNGAPVGRLIGAPYVAKDIHATAGLRTTKGSPIFRDWVPDTNDPIVQRFLDADALLIGKSNTPEFAAGSQTFNTLFGATRNPFDLTKTVGGSSGGSAAALQTGMALLADGSDLAASLRNPAAFCNVVGFRASSRCAPSLKISANFFDSLSIVGPMARSVADVKSAYCAIFGSEQQTAHRTIASWLELTRQQTEAQNQREKRPLKIAYSLDGNGQFPVQNEVRKQLENCLLRLKSQGHEVFEACPDMTGVDECFQTLRGLYFVECFGNLYQQQKHLLKDTVVWNIEQGLALNAAAIAKANLQRSAIFERVHAFMNRCDVWALPTSQVLPFSIDDPYPKTINGEPLVTYIDWLKSCYWLTVAGHPAISIPGGFAEPVMVTGIAEKPLPVGLQLVGKWMQDEELLNHAEHIERQLA
jgi:amidase